MIEKTAWSLKVAFNGISFCGQAKTLPGYQADDKLNISTDCSLHGLKKFMAPDQYEITQFTITMPLDMVKIEALRVMIMEVDTLVITSLYTGSSATFEGAWISAITPDSIELDGVGTYSVVFDFDGTDPVIVAGTPPIP